MPEGSEAFLLLDSLSEDFVARLRRGENPSPEEYARRHPEVADQIRQLFPMLAQLEPPAPAPIPDAGRRIGNYRLLRELGRGGMGIVYEAVQEPLGRRVALKVLTAAAASQPGIERFRREAAAAARLHHSNIVPVFEAGQDGDVCFYAMQYIPGRNLAQFIEDLLALRGRPEAVGPATVRPPREPRHPTFRGGLVDLTVDHLAEQAFSSPEERSPSPAPWPMESLSGPAYFERVAQIGLQAAQALAYAHEQGFIHRDIKPGNLLLDTRGTVWIADFGLVKTTDSELTASGALLGTLRYLSPERLAGQCDARSDVYALGLTLYELVALWPAFPEMEPAHLVQAIGHREPTPPRQLAPQLPRDLETIILKAIQKSPESRYLRTADLAEDLRRFLAGEPVLARRTGVLERVWLWSKRYPLSAASLFVLGVAILLTMAAAIWTAHQAVRHAAALEISESAAWSSEQSAKAALKTAEEERDARGRALLRAEGMRLVAQSELVRPSNPALALLLAVEASQRAPGLLANNAMQESLDECRELGVFRGHKGPLLSAQFRHDGSQILTCSEDGSARLWETRGGQSAHIFEEKDLVQAQLSPDGRRLVTLAGSPLYRRFFPLATNTTTHDWENRGPRVTLWDAETGRPLTRWQPRQGERIYWMAFAAGAAFSGDSRRVVTFFAMSSGGHPLVHDTETGRLVAELTGPGPVLAVAISPDGQTVATAPADDTVRLWDTETGRCLHVLKEHRCNVGGLHFSADGRQLLSLGTGKKLTETPNAMSFTESPDDSAGRLWDVHKGQQVLALEWSDAARMPWALGQWTPDGRHVVLADAERGLRRWNTINGVAEPEGPRPRLSASGLAQAASVALHPDGSAMLFANLDRGAHLVTRSERTTFLGHEHRVVTAAFRADGRQIVTASADGTARIFSVPTPGMPQPERPDCWPTPTGSALSPDGGRLLVPSKEISQSFILDTASTQILARAETAIDQAVFTQEGGEVLLMGRAPNPAASPTLELWDAATGQKKAHVPLPDARLLATCPRGRLLLLADRSGPPLIWDRIAQRKLCALAPMATDNLAAVFSPDGQSVALTHHNTGRVDLWDTTTGQERHKIRERAPHLGWIGFLQEGRQGVAYYTDNSATFRLFDIAKEEELLSFTDRTLRPPLIAAGYGFDTRRANFFQVSRDGRYLVGSPYMNVVGVWDLHEGGEPRRVLSSHTGQITCTAFRPDGQRLVTAAEDRTVRLWNVETGREELLLKGHDAAVSAVAFDREGAHLATAARDQSIRLWSLQTGEELARLRWPRSESLHLAFTPDGQRLVIRGSLTCLWDLNVERTARARLPRTLTDEERTRFGIANVR